MVRVVLKVVDSLSFALVSIVSVILALDVPVVEGPFTIAEDDLVVDVAVVVVLAVVVTISDLPNEKKMRFWT